MSNYFVVNNVNDCPFQLEGAEVISAKAYLTDPRFSDMPRSKVFNLCRSYRYQSMGYYVSLIAEARGHKVIPSIATVQDYRSQTVIRAISEDIHQAIQQSFSKLKSPQYMLNIYFGRSISKQYDDLSRKIYSLFPAPLLRAYFVYHRRKWVMQNISPVHLNEIPESHKAIIQTFAKDYFSKKRVLRRQASKPYFLAILVNPEELVPPSDKKAIQKFIKAAETVGFNTELISKADYDTLAEFDALFIRETTSVNHYTYRFSRRANAEGMAVIDDPHSILKCSNKVYLAEMLTKAKVPMPKTLIIHKGNRHLIRENLGFPCVIKRPDGSFSNGVKKIADEAVLDHELDEMLKLSELVVAQEFLPTEFDWRIGIIDKAPLFACKYFMARNHWQIYNWEGKEKGGGYQTVAIEDVPKPVLDAALRAANLIGNGFYGVDLKEIGKRVCVIEVNDNPSVDCGIEDAVIQDRLYLTVMDSLKRRVEKRKPVGDPVSLSLGPRVLKDPKWQPQAV